MFEVRPFGVERLVNLLNRWTRYPLWVPLGIAFFVGTPTLFAPLMMDDFLHQTMLTKWMSGTSDAATLADPYGWLNLFAFNSGNATGAVLRDAGEFPWWTVDELKLQFWRPLSSAAALVDFVLWPKTVFLAHLHSLVWYLAVVAGAAMSLGELRHQEGAPSPRLLLLTTLLFATHPTHVIPVLWIANRNALLATAFGFFSLYFYLRGLRSKSWSDSVLALVCTALALLSAEFSLSSLAYLLAFAVYGGRATLVRRFQALAGHLVLIVIWAANYVFYGFGARGSGFYLHPLREGTAFFSHVPQRAIALFGDLLGFVPAGIILTPTAQILFWSHGLIVIALTMSIGRWFLRALPQAEASLLRWLSLGALFAIVPTLASLPASRLLLPATLASSYFFALCLRFCWRAALEKRRYRGLLLAGIIRHLVGAPFAFLATSGVVTLASYDAFDLANALPQVLQRNKQEALNVFVLNATDPTVSLTLPATVEHLHPRQSASWRWQFIASVPAAIEWYRPRSNTLIFSHLEGAGLLSGMTGRIFRLQDGGASNLKVGDRLIFDGYEVHIEALDRQAHTEPSRIRLEFTGSAAAPSNRFLYWNGKRLIHRPPPEVGVKEVLSWTPGPFGM